jgi:phosphatidylserine/phosphatidylglycerophosphate/cardiolipin synthase-like enzyme
MVVDRTKSSRMGWSDISISLSGPIVSSLAIHFVDRWYSKRTDAVSCVSWIRS